MVKACPVYGDLNYPNFNGLPPIPLCCQPLSSYPTCETPTYQVPSISKVHICELLPDVDYTPQYILVNLPILTFLLITAIPRFFLCMLYDVGLAINNVVSDTDKFMASLLDIGLAPFIGFAEGASNGGCNVLQGIISLFSKAKIPSFQNNKCPFTYTFNTTLQETLETIGFALGVPFGLINTLVSFVIDMLGVLQCYLVNLSITIGVCLGPFSASATVTPFSFFSRFLLFNCACLLGQTGYCPNVQWLIGWCTGTPSPCPVTNSACSNVTTTTNKCQECYNSCEEQATQEITELNNYCTNCYANCVEYCDQYESSTPACYNECSKSLNECDQCVNSEASQIHDACTSYAIQCYAEECTPPQSCAPPTVPPCSFPSTKYFTCGSS